MKPKKVLFIEAEKGNHIPSTQTALQLVTDLHIDLLRRIYGKENVVAYPLKMHLWHRIHLWKSLLIFLLIPFNIIPSSIRKLFHKIEQEGFEKIFFYNSNLGVVCWLCKREFPEITTATFFHNVEADIEVGFSKRRKESQNPNNLNGLISFFKQRILSLKSKLNQLLIKHLIEKKTVDFSDILIILSKRDQDLLTTYYPGVNPKKIKILPLSLLDDMPSPIKGSQDPPKDSSDFPNLDEPIQLLFVASSWAPNVEGLIFFIQQVLPHLPQVRLHVAGSICSSKPRMPENDRVVYHGYVPDLGDLYHQAHFMVLPIFWGGGMKVKVVQALQYGKTLFATTEALVGYQVNPAIGEVCDDAQYFIEKINDWIENKKTYKFNPASRQLYEEEYHPSVLAEKLKAFIE